MDKKDLCEHTRIRLIAAAIGHQKCTKTAASMIPVPGTEQVIAIGTPAQVAQVLGIEPASAQPADSTPLTDLWMHEDMDRDAMEAALNSLRKDLKDAHRKAVDDLIYWRRRALTAETGAQPAQQVSDAPRLTADERTTAYHQGYQAGIAMGKALAADEAETDAAPQPAARVAVPDERALFEAYYNSRAKPLSYPPEYFALVDKVVDGGETISVYAHDWMQKHFEVWMGRAMLVAPPSATEPVGFLPAYELSRLKSGHDGNLRSARFGPSALDGDVPVYLAAPATAGMATQPHPSQAHLHEPDQYEVHFVSGSSSPPGEIKRELLRPLPVTLPPESAGAGIVGQDAKDAALKIPEHIWYCAEHDNFYSADEKGMGQGFYERWSEHSNKFPQSREALAAQQAQASAKEGGAVGADLKGGA